MTVGVLRQQLTANSQWLKFTANGQKLPVEVFRCLGGLVAQFLHQDFGLCVAGQGDGDAVVAVVVSADVHSVSAVQRVRASFAQPFGVFLLKVEVAHVSAGEPSQLCGVFVQFRLALYCNVHVVEKCLFHCCVNFSVFLNQIVLSLLYAVNGGFGAAESCTVGPG